MIFRKSDPIRIFLIAACRLNLKKNEKMAVLDLPTIDEYNFNDKIQYRY